MENESPPLCKQYDESRTNNVVHSRQGQSTEALTGVWSMPLDHGADETATVSGKSSVSIEIGSETYCNTKSAVSFDSSPKQKDKRRKEKNTSRKHTADKKSGYKAKDTRDRSSKWKRKDGGLAGMEESVGDMLFRTRESETRAIHLSRENEALEKLVAQHEADKAKRELIDEERLIKTLDKVNGLNVQHTWFIPDYWKYYICCVSLFFVAVVSLLLPIFTSHYWMFLITIIVFALAVIYMLAYVPTQRKRYSYRFFSWLDPVLEHSKDLRADTSSLTEMRHSAKYARFIFRDYGFNPLLHSMQAFINLVRGKTTKGDWKSSIELIVSVELLAQITTPECMSLVATEEIAWQKIYAKARTLQSVNINRYLSASGVNVVQDTCLLAHALYLQQWESRLIVPFPRPAL
uniref:Uncharacterized protein n=1 Tax=Riboviria sp. TaxID=2585031 RepID=A0A514D970_9VIRU|nr:MAG: hypothetical protein H3RhizoLitter151145_000002 [Riboviria sp.]